jgi:hypothetical protein
MLPKKTALFDGVLVRVRIETPSTASGKLVTPAGVSMPLLVAASAASVDIVIRKTADSIKRITALTFIISRIHSPHTYL